jgi:hypothetical protein
VEAIEMNSNNKMTTLKAILAAAALGLTGVASEAQFGQRLGGPIVSSDFSGYGNGGFNPGFYGQAGPIINSNARYGAYVGSNLPRNIVVSGNDRITSPLSGFQQPRNILFPTDNGYVQATSANVNGQTAYFIGTGPGQLNPAAAAAAGIDPTTNGPVYLRDFSILNNGGFGGATTVTPNAGFNSGFGTNVNTGFPTTSTFQIGTGVNQLNPQAAAAAGINPNAGSVNLRNFQIASPAARFNSGFNVGSIAPVFRSTFTAAGTAAARIR